MTGQRIELSLLIIFCFILVADPLGGHAILCEVHEKPHNVKKQLVPSRTPGPRP